MRIGFVGTGTMGTPIAGCLIRAGHSLSVYDRRPRPPPRCAQQGAVHADSGFAAARDSDVVFTSLPGPREFEAAMLEPQTGILAGLQPGAAHIDLTTNAPKTIARIGEACRSRGVELIDAPVSGRPPSMTVMVGATDSRFRQIPAAVRSHRRQRLPRRPKRRRRDRQAGDAIPGLHQFHRLDRRHAHRRQGRDRSRNHGADRSGQRRPKPHLRQYPSRRVSRHLCRRRHSRHRRQGYRTRLPTRP